MTTSEVFRLALLCLAVFMVGIDIKALWSFARYQPGPLEKRQTRRQVHADLIVVFTGLVLFGFAVIGGQLQRLHEHVTVVTWIVLVAVVVSGIGAGRILRHMSRDAR